MMTKEEIQEARKVRYDEQAAYSARVYHDYCERALGLLPKALDALEEARREIARLEKLALTGDSGYCSGCERVLPSAEINFTDEQDYCSPCLAEATKPRLAAATMRVQGEGESVEAFLARTWIGVVRRALERTEKKRETK